MTRSDIKVRSDVERLVDEFYDRVLHDSVIGPSFSHVDWVKHKPVMYSFWSSMMLGEQSYGGNPFQKHIPLQLTRQHFDIWLRLFRHTVDDLFEGELAEEIKSRANQIANVFQLRLGI